MTKLEKEIQAVRTNIQRLEASLVRLEKTVQS